MTLSDLASIGSLVSGVAVLVSLVYLSLQIRQNARHSKALIQQGRAARIADTALRLAELRESDGLDKCFEGSPDVSAKDLARFLYTCRAAFVSAEDSFFQKRNGLLDDIAFQSYEASLRVGFGAPGLGAGWLMTREMYEPEFRAYMDGMLGDARSNASGASRGLANWRRTLDERAKVAARGELIPGASENPSPAA
jgi:hypothetical protein